MPKKAAINSKKTTATPKIVTPKNPEVIAAASNATAANQPTPSLQPISELLKSSWELLKLVWMKLLLISLVVVGLSFVVSIIGGLAIGGLGIGAVASGLAGGSVGVFALLGGLIGLILVVAYVVIMSAFEAGLLLIIAAPKSANSAMTFMKQGFVFAWPLIMANLVIGFLSLGGMFLFLIPGVAISVLLSLTMFEIVFQQQPVTAAMKNSATLVSKNFGVFLNRWLVVVGIAIAYSFIMGILMAIPGINLIAGLANNFAGVVFSWFFLCYWYLVYQQVRAGTKPISEPKSSLAWMYIVGGIGWILMILMGVAMSALVATVGSQLMKSKVPQMDTTPTSQQKWLDSAATTNPDAAPNQTQLNQGEAILQQAIEQSGAELSAEERAQLQQLQQQIKAQMQQEQ